MGAFTAYMQELRSLPPEPEYEPEVDERDEKEERELRESEDLMKGALMKGMIAEGHGTTSPKDGDLVILHYTVSDLNQKLLQSTRTGLGGSGQPEPFVLGKGARRLPRGWELALYGMREGERCALRVHPRYGYAHKECGLAPPPGADVNQELLFDLQLVALYSKGEGARLVGKDLDLFKVPIVDPEGWENPRPPYEVEVRCCMRVASGSGRWGEGDLIDNGGDEPLRWAIGDGNAPPGLEQCVCTMVRGERAAFLIPAAAARGGTLLPSPPPDVSWVELMVTLQGITQVRDLTGRGELIKRRLRDGVGEFPMGCPLEDSRVRLHYKVRMAGERGVVYDSRGPDGAAPPVEFDSGMGTLPQAVDMCSRLMLPGEVSVVQSTWAYAYAGRDDAPAGLAPGSDVEFEIELLGFDKSAAWVQMGAAEKLEAAASLKEQGSALFKQAQYKFAESKYAKALKVLSTATQECESQAQLDEVSRQKVAVMVNLAILQHRIEQYGEAITWCSKAIKEDPHHPKAYFRRGVAHGVLGHWQEAAEDLAAVVELDESLKGDVEKELARMQARERAGNNKQRQEMKSFFSRNQK